jgi:hypothetical protein
LRQPHGIAKYIPTLYHFFFFFLLQVDFPYCIFVIREDAMHIRDQLQRMLDRKQQEIRDLELQLEKAKTYVQALQDSMRFLPKSNGQGDVVLRPGSTLAKTQEILKAAGKPLHITEILKALSKPTDKKHRLSLSGSISSYVRKGLIFDRPSPNTFGLLEANKVATNGSEADSEDFDLPEEFGADK